MPTSAIVSSNESIFRNPEFWKSVQTKLGTQVYIRSRLIDVLGSNVFEELCSRAKYEIKVAGFKTAIKMLTGDTCICFDCQYGISRYGRCHDCIDKLGPLSSSTYIRPQVAKPDVPWSLFKLSRALTKYLDCSKLTGKWTLAKLKKLLPSVTYAHLLASVNTLEVADIRKFVESVRDSMICVTCNLDIHNGDQFQECYECRKIAGYNRYAKFRTVEVPSVEISRLDIHFDIGKALTKFFHHSPWREIHQHHIKDWFTQYHPELNADLVVQSVDWVRTNNPNCNTYVAALRLINSARFCPTCDTGYLKDDEWQVCYKCRKDPTVLMPANAAPKKYKVLELDGRSFVHRGYEGKLIRKLLTTKLRASDIKTDVTHKSWLPLGRSKWLPDLLIRDETFIEVKSNWTLFGIPDALKRNRLKNKTYPNVVWFIGTPRYGKELKWTRLPREWWRLRKLELKELLQ